MPDYLILVADQSRARTFTRARKFSPLIQDSEWDHAEGRLPVRERVSDQQGVGFSSSGSGRDAMGDPQAIKDADANRFAQKLCQRTEQRLARLNARHLIVVAPPRFLGQLRSAMRGELDFEAALDERVALLRGLPVSLIKQALDEARLTAGARQLVQTMRANGAKCYLVSGGFTAITGPIAVACGFHGDHANILETKDGLLTGTVTKPVLDRDSKLQFLDRYCASLGIGREAAACIGDGANDLAMLQAAGLGVAFNGKPLLREAVTLQLDHTDLTGLLYLQGYRQSDFVDS